jgi:hypothetical protein
MAGRWAAGRWLGAAGVLALLAGVACRQAMGTGGEAAPAAEHPRARLFAGRGFGWPAQAAVPARLHVLFTPDLARCTPEVMQVARALRRIAAEHSDMRVWTILPRSGAATRTLYGEALPGRRLVVAEAAVAAEGELAPVPRIEVWTGDGRLLLLRSVARTVREDELYDEILWTRSFTAPVAAPRP